MRIRNLLAVNTLVSLGVACILAASILYSSILSARMNAGLTLANGIMDLVYERIRLRDEYYIHREERPRALWFARTRLLKARMDQAGRDFQGTEDQELLARMREESRAILAIFQRLVDNTPALTGPLPRRGLAEEYDKILFGQLNIRASDLNSDALKLVDLRLGDLAAFKRARDWLFSVSLGIVVALALSNGLLIGRSLSRGMRRLQQGASAIGGGNLEYRLGIDTDDEIGDLARSIDSMASALKASFTSIRDLDERVALRTAELAASNRELEAFSYSVAHDLRSPLRAIDGFSRILREDSGASLDAEGRRLLGVICDSARDMDALISNLLEIARLGRTELTYARIDMASMARSVFSGLADPGARGDFDFRVGDLPEASADRVLIERVWSNLFSNAVKYSLPSPLHIIEVEGRAEGGMLSYWVKDRGVGFDDRYKEKLFGVFQRLHDKKDFEGNGVGLAIVERVISRHGGKVWAEGRLGEGATFFFSLPARS